MWLLVPTLSLPEKLKVGRTSTLLLFGLGVKSLSNGQSMDITRDGKEPVLPKAAKIMLIVPSGGLEEVSLCALNPVWLSCPLG